MVATAPSPSSYAVKRLSDYGDDVNSIISDSHNPIISQSHNENPAPSAPLRLCVENTPSSESLAVLAAGCEIWRTYFERFPSFDYSIRERLRLNRPDVGWYQIRQALKLYGESSEGRPTDFSQFEAAYAALADKLCPQVYEYGFLR